MQFLDEPIENSGLKVGDKSPDFALNTDKGEKWRLSDQFGKVTALLFYPQNETLVCTKQLCSVRDHWIDYLATKASIVGISPGSPNENSNFSGNYGLPLPILADPDKEITKLYGSHWLFPISFTRAVVVIDASGFIRHRKIMLRVFRPTDRSIIASIYAARTDFIDQHFHHILKESKERNENLLQ